MKSLLIALSFLSFTSVAQADVVTCALSQIIGGMPSFWENKVVKKDLPTELKTTNGLFSGKVFYQEGQGGYSIILKYGDVAAGGFFDGSPKSPTVSLFVDAKHAQINCHVESE